MTDYYSKEEEGSIFNMALAVLKRIDNYLNLIAKASIMKDTVTWYLTLRALFREISFKLTETEQKEINDLFEKIDVKYLNDKRTLPKLEDIDMKLRYYMNKYHLLMPSKDDPRHSIYGR
jgi:hypothetical protein